MGSGTELPMNAKIEFSTCSEFRMLIVLTKYAARPKKATAIRKSGMTMGTKRIMTSPTPLFQAKWQVKTLEKRSKTGPKLLETYNSKNTKENLLTN